MAEKKVLIAYGTRYGSARIVAGEIAEYLIEKGAKVDTVDLRKEGFKDSLESYDLVVVGSSVAMFMWIGKVKRFLKKCRKAGVKTVVYITCGTVIENEAMAREKFLDKVVSKVGLEPVLTQPVGPVLDFRPGGVPDGTKNRIKNTIQTMAKDRFQADGLMDLRDKDRFDGFLRKLGDLL